MIRFAPGATGAMSCLAMALAGCTVGPDCSRPRLDAPASYAYATGTAAPLSAQGEASLAHWWTLYGDPTLDALVDQAMRDNIDLAMASSRIREARQQLALAKAGTMPEVDASASANRTRISKNGGFSQLASALGGGSSGSSSGIGLPGDTISTYSAGFDASWEPDLFGGGKRSQEAAQADLASTVWDRRDAQLRLSAEIARSYFSLRSLQARRAVQDQLVATLTRQAGLVQTKVSRGLLPGDAMARPRTLLEQAKGEAAQLKGAERSERAALALLLGTTVEALPAGLGGTASPLSPRPLDIPAGLPSELLKRRPDINAAERSLAAATARIGVARAARFPHLSLTGVVELISTGLASLVSGNSIQALAGGQIGVPLLDFGRGKAREGIAREQAEQANLAYRQTVLGAFSDVEQALARVDAARTNENAFARQLDQAQLAQASAATRLDAGLTDYLPLAEAQEQTFAARQALLQGQFDLRQAELALFKALGGGWEDADATGDTADVPPAG